MFLEIFEEAQFERPNKQNKNKKSNEEENNQT